MGNDLNMHIRPLKVLGRELFNKAIIQKLKNKLPIPYLKQTSNVSLFIYKVLWKHLSTLRRKILAISRTWKEGYADCCMLQNYLPVQIHAFFFPPLVPGIFITREQQSELNVCRKRKGLEDHEIAV